LSHGRAIAGPKALTSSLKLLRRASRALSRKQLGSSNRTKPRRRLARLYARIANIRNDATHKATTHLVKTYRRIGIEDLNVRGMMVGKRHIGPVGAFEQKVTVLPLGFANPGQEAGYRPWTKGHDRIYGRRRISMRSDRDRTSAAARRPDDGRFTWRVCESLTPSMQNWHVGSSTRENLSERLLTPLTSTPQPSIGSQRRRLKCIFCSVAPGYPISSKRGTRAIHKRAWHHGQQA